MAVRYVSKFETKLRTEVGTCTLLWGDRCRVLGTSGTEARVRARGREGSVATADLASRVDLLEVYVIDVGQGDGVLMKTPDGRWHLIDAGVAAAAQMTRKGAANFLRWKFQDDFEQTAIALESVTMSHPDYDHFGGLTDVLAGVLPPSAGHPERRFEVRVENFYHGGMGRFASGDPLGRTRRGEVEPFPRGGHRMRREGTFITELLGGKTDFRSPARPFADRPAGSSFADLAALVGRVPRRVRRLSRDDGHLPGYAPGESSCVIHVLGPILERIGGSAVGLRWLDSESKTRNGHSVVLRVDYGGARILLTGDLNSGSQHLLLSYVPETEFAVDVAKGCHHGSDDVDLEFVRAMAARATVISSGDNEDYAHPRPRVLGASARYGREGLDARGEIVPPLLYSTELARSVKLEYARRVEMDVDLDQGEFTVEGPAETARVLPQGRDAKLRPLAEFPLATDLVYGLVNVRTDGRHILFATLEEKGNDFDTRILRAGASPGS